MKLFDPTAALTGRAIFGGHDHRRFSRPEDHGMGEMVLSLGCDLHFSPPRQVADLARRERQARTVRGRVKQSRRQVAGDAVQLLPALIPPGAAYRAI